MPLITRMSSGPPGLALSAGLCKASSHLALMALTSMLVRDRLIVLSWPQEMTSEWSSSSDIHAQSKRPLIRSTLVTPSTSRTSVSQETIRVKNS